MSGHNAYVTKGFTRGGQIILNNIRMSIQMFNKLMVICGILVLVFIALGSYFFTAKASWQLWFIYLKATFYSLINGNVMIHGMVGHQRLAAAANTIIHYPVVLADLHSFYLVLLKIVGVSVLLSVLVGWVIGRFFSKAGESSTKERILSGSQLLPVAKINQFIKRHSANGTSDIHLPVIENKRDMKLSFEQEFERQHVLIHGSTGTGKSVTISHLLSQIRGFIGHKLAAVDLNGAYVAQYYRKQDVILNPADRRSFKWTIWTDCVEPEDFDNLAEILIPDNPRTEPIWINAPRQIFVEVAKKLKDDPNRSHEKLLKILLTTPIEAYAQYFIGTDAQALTDERIEKTTLSIRAVLASYLKSLRYLDAMQGEEFSITRWAHDDGDHRWLFFATQEKQLAAFRPLIACWLGILSKTCLSLEPDLESQRHIWVVADEIASYRKIPTLSESLAKARKFGVHFVLSLQTYYQFEEAYGKYESIVIVDNLNTQIFFRAKHHDTCEFVSKQLGEQEIEEVRENYSIGANTIRDGVSFGKVRVKRRIAGPEEINTLPDLTCFVQQKGAIPIAKVKLALPKNKPITTAFVPHVGSRTVEDQELSRLIHFFRWHASTVNDDHLAGMVVQTSEDLTSEVAAHQQHSKATLSSQPQKDQQTKEQRNKQKAKQRAKQQAQEGLPVSNVDEIIESQAVRRTAELY